MSVELNVMKGADPMGVQTSEGGEKVLLKEIARTARGVCKVCPAPPGSIPMDIR